MAESRALTLKLLADISDLTKNLDKGTNEVDGFGGKLGDFGKKAGLAFAAAAAAAGAYAIKIGVDGVKAAIEDEQSQVSLAKALENSTGATNQQIKSVEAYILKTSLASGITDDELRPALARLARSTSDTETAQKLLNLALDISIGTGKPLETVANALGKAYDGSSTALGKLGVGLSAAELKSLSFTEVQKKLSDLFGGASAANAETFQGKLDRLKIGFDEAKETIGFALLPILTKLTDFVNDKILPAFAAFTDKLGGADGIGKKIEEVVNVIKTLAQPVFDAWVKVFDKLKQTIKDNKEGFDDFSELIKKAAPVIGTIIGGIVETIGGIAAVIISTLSKAISFVYDIINGAITAINLLIKALNFIPGVNIALIGKLGTPTGGGVFKDSGTSVALSSLPSGFQPTVVPTITNPVASNTGGSVVAGLTGAAAAASKPLQSQIDIAAGVAAFRAAERGDNLLSAAGSAAFRAGERGDTIIITNNVSGAIDSEGTARAIVNVINESFDRGTGGAGRFQNAVT